MLNSNLQDVKHGDCKCDQLVQMLMQMMAVKHGNQTTQATDGTQGDTGYVGTDSTGGDTLGGDTIGDTSGDDGEEYNGDMTGLDGDAGGGFHLQQGGLDGRPAIAGLLQMLMADPSMKAKVLAASMGRGGAAAAIGGGAVGAA